MDIAWNMTYGIAAKDGEYCLSLSLKRPMSQARVRMAAELIVRRMMRKVMPAGFKHGFVRKKNDEKMRMNAEETTMYDAMDQRDSLRIPRMATKWKTNAIKIPLMITARRS